MAELIIDQSKIKNIQALIDICPFGALEEKDGKLGVNAACKLCKLCVKKGPEGAVTYIDDKVKQQIDKSMWTGITVYVDHVDGEIHPVTYELLGKARELAAKIHHPVYAVMMGNRVEKCSRRLLHYGVDKVYVYDQPKLKDFNIETYTNAFEDHIKTMMPSVILVGATAVGRQLAPRVAARLKTGLTADCTVLDIREDTDLIQIRPAFGGNIMAEICTPDNRPQMATVRYKVMNAPVREVSESGEVVSCMIPEEKLATGIEVLNVRAKEPEKTIETADVLVIAGRGVKKEEDLGMLRELAELLEGQLACTRPIVEAGWMDAKKQVGLSGRTVRPKLIITCGVSGSVQFAAGMNNSDCIVAINTDEKASIFKTAHYCIVGDIYKVVPRLTARIRENKEVS
ncbi:FAD-binding protein [Ruminococcus sp. OA3]|uniref:electron transfer flavoprotein subunit alpha n=1 Tax=Ruminococcus sp. OA3 TaxID=2914164 RepID=UPI001F05A7EA|nr:electron transfer flavoprotein subunit alpha/FixB family protein [Ruminococcus sp. OA3]MCH1981676.1 FAD-binding protein [Ruminococcus sp. OA3]